MHNPKKHPLEIFRSRGGHGPLVNRGDASGEGAAPGTPGDPSTAPESERAPHSRWEPRPFELRISAFGAVMLAFVWIVLLAGAYTLGLKRGNDASQRDSDVRAMERGKQIESGVPSDDSATPTAVVNNQPFGVLIISYTKDEAKPAKINELKSILEKSYDIPGSSVEAWQMPSGEVAVYVGRFADRDAPELHQLEIKLRNISDWPFGKKNPFETADVRQYPKPKGGDPKSPATGSGGQTPAKD